MIENFPSAKESRDKLSTRNNQVFREEITRIKQQITSAISNGFDHVSVSTMHEETKKFLEEKGYKVTATESQRDSYWLIKW
jgi:protein-tyrosine-phosphatase